MAYLRVKDNRPIPEKGKGRKLTPKMMEFVDLYMIHKNATKAVELSSYNVKDTNQMAAKLLQHPLIQKEIEIRLQKRAEKAEVKAEYLIQKLMNIIEETQADNPTACLRAIELAGKSIALWKERQEISGPDGEAIKHEQHIKESAAEFSRRIHGLAQRAGTDNVVSLPVRGGTGSA